MADLISLDKIRQGSAPADATTKCRSVVQEAREFMDARTIKPQRAEIDMAVERGDLSRDAGNLVSSTWDLRQLLMVARAKWESESRLRFEEMMARLRPLVRPGKIEEVREIVEREVLRRELPGSIVFAEDDAS